MAGDFVFLDNGAYEGESLDWKTLDSLARDLRPQVLVLPDRLGDMWGTISMSAAYLHRFDLPRTTEAMVVLQAKTWPQLETFHEICPATWIGLPRCVPMRNEILEKPQEGIRYHALGMHNGSLKELELLAALGCSSCDSSAPIWRGMHGYRFGEYWPDLPFHYDAPSEAHNWEFAESNLQRVMEAIERGNQRRTAAQVAGT